MEDFYDAMTTYINSKKTKMSTRTNYRSVWMGNMHRLLSVSKQNFLQTTHITVSQDITLQSQKKTTVT